LGDGSELGDSGFLDQSGFMPFDPADDPVDNPVDRTGFVPIEPQSSATQSPQLPQSPSLPRPPIPQFSPRSSQSVPHPHQQPDRDRSENSMGTTTRSGFGARIPQPSIEAPDYQPTWRQAGRAKAGKSLGQVPWLPLALAQVGTAIALFWVLQQGLYFVMVNWSITLTKIPFMARGRDLFSPMTWQIWMTLGVLFLGSRWLLDLLLMQVYGLRSISVAELETQSPEAVLLLQRWAQQRKFPVPALGILPVPVPIVFSYGCLPYVTRIVVSRGLLDQLTDDEIATLYANELGHLKTWDTPLMSLVMVLLQIPYTLYWVAADWGSGKSAPVSRFSATVIATGSYGLYTGLRWVGLGLSQYRVSLSDRAVAELTGNPNAYTRGLLKLAIGMAKDIQAQGSTRYLLEGFDLLTPLSYRQAASLGSVYPYTTLEPVLQWDWSQMQRFWLSLNQSHPPTGERLRWLARYAQQLKLEPELDIPTQAAPKRPLTGRQWRSLLLQGAPFFGLAFGLGGAFLFTGLGWAGMRFRIDLLAWMYWADFLRWALPMIGFCIGTLIRINAFFPDLPPGAQAASPPLPQLLQDPDRIPLNPVSVQLEGKLLHRPAIAGSLGQDLWLKTSTGIVRLHWTSRWGPIGNLFPQPNRPTDLGNQTLVVTGWFRRGATAWIDVDTLRTAGGRVSRSQHPIWNLIAAAIAAFWGAALIVAG
jgi:Zn-dependent protease with chaperone function